VRCGAVWRARRWSSRNFLNMKRVVLGAAVSAGVWVSFYRRDRGSRIRHRGLVPALQPTSCLIAPLEGPCRSRMTLACPHSRCSCLCGTYVSLACDTTAGSPIAETNQKPLDYEMEHRLCSPSKDRTTVSMEPQGKHVTQWHEWSVTDVLWSVCCGLNNTHAYHVSVRKLSEEPSASVGGSDSTHPGGIRGVERVCLRRFYLS